MYTTDTSSSQRQTTMATLYNEKPRLDRSDLLPTTRGAANSWYLLVPNFLLRCMLYIIKDILFMFLLFLLFKRMLWIIINAASIINAPGFRWVIYNRRWNDCACLRRGVSELKTRPISLSKGGVGGGGLVQSFPFSSPLSSHFFLSSFFLF